MSDCFLDLEPPYNVYGQARFALLPIPYDAMSSYGRGSSKGPAAIIEASGHLEDFDEELGKECHTCGIATLDAVEPGTAGPQAMHEAIFERASTVVRNGKFLFGLGGDHSVSAPLVRAVTAQYGRLSVLQMDAHGDLRDRFQGSAFSHACVMRRIYELGATIVPVGTRSLSMAEHQFMNRHGIEPISARTCMEDPNWMDRALDGLTSPVYVTMDIDALDPAYAPGTGTPEPGGLDFYQVTRLLRRVAAEREVVGADLVEVAPILGQVTSEFLAARLVYKLMAYVQAGRAGNAIPEASPQQ